MKTEFLRWDSLILVGDCAGAQLPTALSPLVLVLPPTSAVKGSC